LKKKIILITGSSGFIGNYFLRYSLSKNYKVIDVLRKKNLNKLNLKSLRKKYSKDYSSIFYSKYSDLKKKLDGKKIYCFINFATLYKNSHLHKEIPSFLNSNILFPSIILDIIGTNVNKVINFGTMMQHLDGKNYLPNNFYASTKSAFEMILNFYALKNKKSKFYNIKFYESFSEIDKRKKLIPTLINNHKKNKLTSIVSSKLELNIIHLNDIVKAIDILLKKNIKDGNYCLRQPRNLKIKSFISETNKNLKRKLKVKFLSNKMMKPVKSKIKSLPLWKPNLTLKQQIKNQFLDANNQNKN
tara:strand:+ start:1046 stop:1948 length:903 start_codon:yes stop_codon:yes gene_type:complete